MDQSTDSLKVVRLLSAMAPRKRQALEALCARRRYRAGETIVSPAGAGSDDVREVGFVLDGAVRVSAARSEEGRIAWHDVGKGGYYGATQALDRTAAALAVTAREDCEVAVMSADAFRRVVGQNARLALALLEDFANALRQAQQRAAGADIVNPVQRVFVELMRVASPDPAGGANWLVNPMPKHRALADRADTTEDDVASAVAHLIRVGVARRRYPALEILEPARLRALCDLR